MMKHHYYYIKWNYSAIQLIGLMTGEPEHRRKVQVELNKGESKNSLASAVFFNQLGEIRD